MAAERKSQYQAVVTEDGLLRVPELELVAGQQVVIELVQVAEVDEDAEFARQVFSETMRDWLEDPEEDKAWSYLQKEV